MPVSDSIVRAGNRRGRLFPHLVAVLALALAAAAPLRAATPAAAATIPIGPLLAGEYAFQAGQLPEAARWYLQAASAAEGDVQLAERATGIAMLANDDALAAQALKLWRQRAPDSTRLEVTAISLALRQGQLRKARRDLQKLLARPEPRSWRHALVALAGGRDPQVVARVLGQLVEAGAIPDDMQAWHEFGRLSLRLDAPELSARIIEAMVQRFPGEPKVTVLHAGQLAQAGQRDQARALLGQVEPRAVDDAEVRAMLAVAYEALGDFASAARVVAQGSQDIRTWGMRASLLARAEDHEALAGLYAELSAGDRGKPDPARRMLLGRIAEFLKRPAEAVDWYRGVAGGPERQEARIRIAVALYELGRIQEAYAEAHALQNDAGSDDDARRNAYLLEGELRRRGNDAAGEIEALDRGLAAYPDASALLYARALAWERQDRIDRAEADLRKVLVSEPDNVAALNALGYTLADRTGRYQEALEMIDRARAAEPDNAAIVDSYGWVLYRLGRKEEALVELRRAWGLMKDPEIGAHLGEVLWLLGRRDEARRYFDEARKLDPDNRSLRRALQKLGLPEAVAEPERSPATPAAAVPDAVPGRAPASVPPAAVP